QVTDGRGHDQLVAAIGADCRAEAIFGPVGCDPTALAAVRDTDPPLIGTGAQRAAGPTGRLRTDVGDRSLATAPVVPGLDRVNHGLVVVYPISVAQSVFGRPNGLDAIYVVAKPGVDIDQLQHALSTAAGPQNKVVPAG